MMEEREESSSGESKQHLVSYPIHTIRGVYDSMLYIHTLVCNISESVTRVASRNSTDEEEVSKTLDFIKRSLDGTDRPDSLIIEEEESDDDDDDVKDEKKRERKSRKKSMSKSPTKKKNKSTTTIIQKSSSKLLHILPEAVSNGFDALIRKAMSAIPGNRKDSSLVLEYDVVLHILPRSLSSRLVSLIEKARTGPQPKQLVSNLVQSMKQRFLPGFWVYNAKCMKPFETIPRSPSKVAMTGYVLEYDVVDENHDTSLTRYMHYDIDRRPFIATVSVPTNTEESSLVEKKIRRESMEDENGEEGRRQQVTTPQSFPCSPYAREALLNDFASYTNGILQAACDRLKTESDDNFVLPQMNQEETHKDLRIDCAGLRVSKRFVSERFVSSRANVSISESTGNDRNNYCLPFFFEFVVAEHFDSIEEDYSEEDEDEEHDKKERKGSKLCVGLSTEHMPLNACVGSVQNTVGYHSKGNILISGKCYKVQNGEFGGSAVVGILCQIDKKDRLRTAFTIDGRLVAKPQPIMMYPGARLFPTVSISSPHISVTCNFSSDEILYPPKCSFRELKFGSRS